MRYVVLNRHTSSLADGKHILWRWKLVDSLIDVTNSSTPASRRGLSAVILQIDPLPCYGFLNGINQKVGLSRSTLDHVS